MAELRFYLDENLPPAIAEQLKRRGIEAVTVRELGLLGESDETHLQKALTMGYVLCTHDTDFIALAAQGIEHAGIIIGQQEKHYVGEWVNGLTLYHAIHIVEDMYNRVDFL
jgi:hypothetical protein